MSETDTPRTDELARKCYGCEGYVIADYMTAFARQLERELAVAREALGKIAAWTGGVEWPMDVARLALDPAEVQT